jgi:hypothetical protein
LKRVVQEVMPKKEAVRCALARNAPPTVTQAVGLGVRHFKKILKAISLKRSKRQAREEAGQGVPGKGE